MRQEQQFEHLNKLFESKQISAQQLMWGRAEIRRVVFRDLYESVELKKQDLDAQLRAGKINRFTWLRERHKLDSQIQPCIGCSIGVCRYGR